MSVIISWNDENVPKWGTPKAFWGSTEASVAPGPDQPAEIMASLDDINANLDGQVVIATTDNTALLQISVARIVRGYLSRVLDSATLLSWNSPSKTPDIIREAAAKLIAAQVYFNQTSQTETTIPANSFAQNRYNEAIAILNQIIAGEVVIPNVPLPTPIEALTTLDFFPIDSTDRAFTIGLRLD